MSRFIAVGMMPPHQAHPNYPGGYPPRPGPAGYPQQVRLRKIYLPNINK